MLTMERCERSVVRVCAFTRKTGTSVVHGPRWHWLLLDVLELAKVSLLELNCRSNQWCRCHWNKLHLWRARGLRCIMCKDLSLRWTRQAQTPSRSSFTRVFLMAEPRNTGEKLRETVGCRIAA